MEPEVTLGHRTLRAPGDVSLDEAICTSCWALTQAQNMLHRESGGIAAVGFHAQGADNGGEGKGEARLQHLDVREELLNRL
jgi:hypothetical protein